MSLIQPSLQPTPIAAENDAISIDVWHFHPHLTSTGSDIHTYCHGSVALCGQPARCARVCCFLLVSPSFSVSLCFSLAPGCFGRRCKFSIWKCPVLEVAGPAARHPSSAVLTESEEQPI